jgi:hypothetical protein
MSEEANSGEADITYVLGADWVWRARRNQLQYHSAPNIKFDQGQVELQNTQGEEKN